MKLVTPQLLARLDSLKIPSTRRLKAQHRGEQQSVRKGSSLEFSDYREYIQGDDLRNVDWNVYARAEKYFLKLFLEEESKPVYFLIDASESMNFGDPSKLNYSLALAACLTYVSLRRYDKPSIVLLKDKGIHKIPMSSLQNFFLALQHLDSEKGSGGSNLTAGLRRFVWNRRPKGSCFLLSDFYSSDGFSGVKWIAAAGYELHCIHVLSPEEERPELRGDLKLLDSENADVSEISVSPHLLKLYDARLQSFRSELKRIAHQCGARYHSINTETPLASLIFGGLKRTGLLQ